MYRGTSASMCSTAIHITTPETVVFLLRLVVSFHFVHLFSNLLSRSLALSHHPFRRRSHTLILIGMFTLSTKQFSGQTVYALYARLCICGRRRDAPLKFCNFYSFLFSCAFAIGGAITLAFINRHELKQ